MKLFVLSLSVANAGWFSNFCERNIVADYPYEYEMYATAWVQRQVDQLKIKQAWGTASTGDRNNLKVLEAELERRQALARLVGE